jgi:hypothetical protein
VFDGTFCLEYKGMRKEGPKNLAYLGRAEASRKLVLLGRRTMVKQSGKKNVILTSILAWRKTLRAGKNNRYFDFKHLKICAHLNISYIFL